MVAPLLDLCSRLAGDQSPATHGAHRVPGGGALDAVPLPGFLPKDEDGDAGEDAAEQAAQPAALAHVVSVALDETARDTRPTQACFAVAHAAADSLLPLLRHLLVGLGLRDLRTFLLTESI